MKLPLTIIVGAGLGGLAAAEGFGVYAGMPPGPLQLASIFLFNSLSGSNDVYVDVLFFGIVAAVRFCVALAQSKPKRSRTMVVCGVLSLIVAVWAAAWTFYVAFLAAARTGVTNPRVLAPSIAEGFFVLAFGLLAGAAILAGNRFLMDRALRKSERELQAVF